MLPLPSAAEPLFMNFSIAFTPPTFKRILILMIGGILCMGRRTTTGTLWTVRSMMRGHFSSYHRVFSRAPWSLWKLGRVLATAILQLIPPEQSVAVAMDDTVAGHMGKCVYGKGCHRNAVRSTQTLKAWRWGHKWVVLTVQVKFPFASRAWALPVLAALYRPKKVDQAEGRRHKTPPELARQLMAALIHWFPHRKFISPAILGADNFSKAIVSQRW